MRRMVVASPAYLVEHGVPRTPDDLARHNCLSLGQQRGWVFRHPELAAEADTIKVSGFSECNDGAVLHEWRWPGAVWPGVHCGRLAAILRGPADLGARCLAGPADGHLRCFPQRRHLPLRVRCSSTC